MSDNSKAPRNFFVVLIVLALVYLLALANGGRQRPAALAEWQTNLRAKAPSFTRFDPNELESAARKGNELLIPRQMMVVTNHIKEQSAGLFSSGVRTFTLTLAGADKFALQYVPSSADARSMVVTVDPFSPGTNVCLTIQKYGGVIVLRRKSALADAKIRID